MNKDMKKRLAVKYNHQQNTYAPLLKSEPVIGLAGTSRLPLRPQRPYSSDVAVVEGANFSPQLCADHHSSDYQIFCLSAEKKNQEG